MTTNPDTDITQDDDVEGFAIDIFMKIKDIDGESEASSHEGWVVLESVSMPIYRSIQ